MTQESENQFLEKLEAYFDQQLVQIKAQSNLEIDTLLVQYHSEAVEGAKANVIKDNSKRLNEIARYKDKYGDHPEIVNSSIKSVNFQFNIFLDMKQTLANIHYNDCVNRGLSVQKVDLSIFKVDEDDGLK